MGAGVARADVADDSAHDVPDSPQLRSGQFRRLAASAASSSASARDVAGVLALDHDPQRLLGARRPDQDPATIRQLVARGAHRVGELEVGLPLVLVTDRDGALLLREQRDARGQLGQPLARCGP